MNFLINRSDAIGDTILTLPLATLIKDQFPQARVYFLIDKKTRDLFTHNPQVDGTIVLPRRKNPFFRFLYLKKKFNELHIDHYVYVGGTHLPSLVAFLLQVPFRGGLKSKWQAWLFLNRGLRQKRSRVEMHEALYNVHLLAPLGIVYEDSMRERYRPRFFLSNEELAKSGISLRASFREMGLLWKDEFVVVHPGMTGHTLNWPARNYSRFIQEMEQAFPQRFSFVVSFTRGKSDLASIKVMQEELDEGLGLKGNGLRNRICFLDGSLSGLRNYMGVLAQAKLFIGPSTGTTHLANTLDVPLIGIYSPIKVQPSLRWGPFQHLGKAPIAVPDVACGENFHCAGRACPYYECMSKIEVSKVVKLARGLIDSADSEKIKSGKV